jgi:hypothetical protein
MQMNMHIRAYPILQLETSKETLFCFMGAKETIWIENKQYKNKVKHNKGTNKFGRHNPLEKAKQCMFLEGPHIPMADINSSVNRMYMICVAALNTNRGHTLHRLSFLISSKYVMY